MTTHVAHRKKMRMRLEDWNCSNRNREAKTTRVRSEVRRS